MLHPRGAHGLPFIVAAGESVGGWQGLADTCIQRDVDKPVLITVVIFKLGCPSMADLEAAAADMDALYCAHPMEHDLADHYYLQNTIQTNPSTDDGSVRPSLHLGDTGEYFVSDETLYMNRIGSDKRKSRRIERHRNRRGHEEQAGEHGNGQQESCQVLLCIQVWLIVCKKKSLPWLQAL